LVEDDAKKMSADRLSQAFQEFKRIPFPPSGGEGKDLGNAHGSLILYDADTAGVVTSLLNNRTPSEERIRQVRELQADYELEEGLEKLIKAYPDTDIVGKLARQYMSYYYEIRKLLYAANSYLLSIGVNIPDWRVIENYRDRADPVRPALKSALAGEREVLQQEPFVEAWLGYALYCSARLQTLEEVIESADAINHAIPNADEIAWAFLRLRRRGWLLIKGDSYGLTPEGKRKIDSIVRGAANHHSFEMLEKWTLTHPPDEKMTRL